MCVSIGTLADFYALHALAATSNPSLFIIIFLALSLLSSPIQTGYSDYFRRKKVLIVALLACECTFFYLFFFENQNELILILVIFLTTGLLGNVIEISWAAMGDERIKSKNARSIFAASNAFMALSALFFGWSQIHRSHVIGNLVLNNSPQKFEIPNLNSGACLLLSLLVILAVIFLYKDKHDSDPESSVIREGSFYYLLRHVFTHIRKLFSSKRFCLAVTTFLFWEMSFYLIHQLGVDLKINPFGYVTFWMAAGYVLGTLFLPLFRKVPEFKLVLIGHLISIAPLITSFCLTFFYPNLLMQIVNGCFTIYSFGAAFLSPCLFSTISSEKKIHEQGVVFGAFGSTDTLATALAWALGLFLNKTISFFQNCFSLNIISPLVMILSCFILMVLAIALYGKFYKTKTPKTSR